MGIFGLFGGANINDGIEKYKNTPGAVLLDVRTKEEYKSGHIPESRHLSVQNIENVKKAVPDKKLRCSYTASAVQEAARRYSI